MLLDYMFAIQKDLQNINEQHVGVVLDIVSFDSVETYSYFIGFYINNDASVVKIFLKDEKYVNNPVIFSSNIPFYNISNYYSQMECLMSN